MAETLAFLLVAALAGVCVHLYRCIDRLADLAAMLASWDATRIAELHVDVDNLRERLAALETSPIPDVARPKRAREEPSETVELIGF